MPDDARVRFHVDIDQITEGRPEGRLLDRRTGADTPFAGWVELLRLMEGQLLAPGESAGRVDADEAKRGSS